MLVAGGGLCVGVSRGNLAAAGAALGDAVRLSTERATVPGSQPARRRPVGDGPAEPWQGAPSHPAVTPSQCQPPIST
jgi:hypothetical protein